MKTAYLIIIGDEILNGLTLDKNSNYLAYHLNDAGLDVTGITIINDQEAAIHKAFKEGLAQADVVISTGGLGPTKDDITKATMAEIFDCNITFNDTARQYVEDYLKDRNISLEGLNKGHAYLPEKAEPLQNKQGTAPGILIDENDKVAIALPGVPAEMQYLTDHEVIPYLKQRFQLPATQHKHFNTVGIREAILAEKIADIEGLLPSAISLAYLPSWGIVRLRLTGRGYSREAFQQAIQPFADQLHQKAGEYIYGYDDQSLEAAIGELLKNKSATLATAESCTGGYLAHQITNVSGSSEYFTGSVIAYSNNVKMQELGVTEAALKNHGAVSEPTVEEMVKGVNSKLETDYAIATSGIAGPSGGTPDKPVGTVWIAAGTKDQVFTHRFQFFRDRFKNIHISAIMGLDMLRRLLQFGEVKYGKESL